MPNILDEWSWGAEWKYNRKKFVASFVGTKYLYIYRLQRAPFVMYSFVVIAIVFLHAATRQGSLRSQDRNVLNQEAFL
jgi:hypothetical protein